MDRFLTRLVFCLTLGVMVPRALYAMNRATAPTGDVIQNRKYQLDQEVHLHIGALPTDPFYKGLLFTLGYTWHLNDFVAWDIASLSYAFNFDTHLKREVERVALGTGAVAPGFARPQWMVMSHLIFKPFYGKEAWLNTDVIYLEAFMFGGPAFLRVLDFPGEQGKPRNRFALGFDVGLGVRTFLTQSISVRVDFSELVYFVVTGLGTSVRQTFRMQLGAAWTFGDFE